MTYAIGYTLLVTYAWLKAGHLIFVIFWIAGLFMLPRFLVYRPKPDQRRRFRILRTDRGFRVHGTPGSEEELERALRDVGAKSGDEVEVEGEVLELQ